jgi:zinc transport system ATP-binding protein
MSITWSEAHTIHIDNVSFAYHKTIALDRITLHIKAGEHVAVVGSNGSGKSTLIRVILGLLDPQQGDIRINGIANIRPNRRQIQQAIAWIPQRQAVGTFPLLVHELWQSSRNPTAARSIAQQFEVDHLLQRSLHTLSGGQLQRVFLVRALASLAGGSGVLLADEPTSALDFVGQSVVAEFLHQIPSTVLVVTHDRHMMQRCHRVIEMAGGQIREVNQ